MADKVVVPPITLHHINKWRDLQHNPQFPTRKPFNFVKQQKYSKGLVVEEMAQAMASMAGLCGSSQAVLEGSLQISGSTRLSVASSIRPSVPRSGLMIKAQQVPAEPETSRRAVLGLVAAGLASGSFVQAVLAEAKPIKVGPPPPPSGGLRK